MNRKKYMWIGAILLVIALAVYSFAGKTPSVETVTIATGSISVQVNETGYVQAADDFEVQALQPGYIKSVEAQIGDQVQAGQVLLRLENTDLHISLTSAKSQLTQSQAGLAVAQQALSGYLISAETSGKSLERIEQLFKAGAATQAELENARSSLKSLQETIAHQREYIADLEQQVAFGQQAVEQITEKSGQLIVVSPLAGTLLDLPLKKGAYVNYGTPVAQIGIPEKLEIKVDVLGDQMGDITTGQKVYISAAIMGEQVLTGRVQTIRPRAFTKVSALGVEQRRVPVIITMDSTGKLKPGYEVQVAIETAAKSGIVIVLREAVQSTTEGEKVLLVVDGRIKHQAIKSGLRNGDYIEIISGLKPGDVIVQDASEDLADDTRVKAAKIHPAKQ